MHVMLSYLFIQKNTFNGVRTTDLYLLVDKILENVLIPTYKTKSKLRAVVPSLFKCLSTI